jgi:hypothetical protein
VTKVTKRKRRLRERGKMEMVKMIEVLSQYNNKRRKGSQSTSHVVDKFYNGKIEKWKGKKGKEKGYYKVN